MQKPIINQYKLKRKWQRFFKRGIQPIVSPDAMDVKSTKDFAWHKSKQNPFYRSENNTKRKVYLFLGLLSFFGMIALGLYHPFFFISKIEVTGLKRLKNDEFVSATKGIMDYKKFFILPAKDYFVCDVQEIKDILMQRFPLSTAVVQKSFPNSLTVFVQEKISTIIYDNGNEYSYLGLDGQIVEKIRKVGEDEWTEVRASTTTISASGVTSTEEIVVSRNHVPAVKSIIEQTGDYPVVYALNAKAGSVNDTMIEKSEVTAIIDWFEFLNNRLMAPFSYMRIENAEGDATIHTSLGWDAKVNLKKDIKPQMQALETTIQNVVKEKRPQYVDVRFVGKVYWQ